MAKFVVDLNTKFISSDASVYLARAGKQGHLFERVRRAKAIGPDLPNLNLDLTNGLANEHRLIAKINRSRKLGKWLNSPAAKRGAEPSHLDADYDNVKKSSGHSQVEGVIKTYFQEMKAGDVLVIPSPYIFEQAIIAEVLPLESTPVQIDGAGRYYGYKYQGRRFGHSRRINMTDLPRSVIEIARAPTALANIAKIDVKKKIFDLCYTDYSFDDVYSAQIQTTKPDFRPFDANVLNAFVRMVSQNIELLEHSNDAQLQLKGIVDAAFTETDAVGPSVRININSPGHLAILDRSIIPLVISTMLGVFVAADFDFAAIAQDQVEVEVHNSKVEEALDLCSRDVGRLTQSMLQFMPEDKFQQTCDLLRQAHNATGAKSKTLVERKQ